MLVAYPMSRLRNEDSTFRNTDSLRSPSHNNDPIAHLSDILAYYETVQYVKNWVDAQNDEGTPTLLISVSDHETGGLALGRQLTEAYPDYLW